MFQYLAHPRLRWLIVLTGFFILLGVIVFSSIEGWSIIDSFYFTVATVTTVGYGDLVPTHDASKLLASFYMLMTIPLILVSVGLITEFVHESPKKKRRIFRKGPKRIV